MSSGRGDLCVPLLVRSQSGNMGAGVLQIVPHLRCDTHEAVGQQGAPTSCQNQTGRLNLHEIS